jgi:F-type H+-transporting ATPase subunit delta
MEASSRAALVEARARLDEVTRPASGVIEKAKDRLTGHARAISAPEQLALADELFAVARVLNGQLALRRALSDPSGKPEDRAGLARRLFAGKVSAVALDLIETVARQRWSHPVDLVDAFTALATEASLDAADARGELEGVEDELFRFGRIIGGDRELVRILSDRKAPPRARAHCWTGWSRAGSVRSPSSCCATCSPVRTPAARRSPSSGSPTWPAAVGASRWPA